MAATTKGNVTIKGNKDGLVFVLNDQCDYGDLLQELTYKLEKSHQQILSGPATHVHVRLGQRTVTEAQRAEIVQIIERKENLIVKSIEAKGALEQADFPQMECMRGIIRSGQTVYHDGDIIFLGDVNPGGAIIATGNIYVLGALRGMAHAGFSGNEEAIIAAAYLRPTQLRIAEVISRPPDEWGIDEAYMEFAYLRNGQMEIDKIMHLHRIRPEQRQRKGE
jgi:septum site-determining protein MinC